MDVALHLLGQGLVDEALGGDACEALEAVRYDQGAEVATAGRRTRMPCVQMALVLHLDVDGLQTLA